MAKDYKGCSVYNQSEIVLEFKNQGIDLPISKSGYVVEDMKNLLAESGIGLPDYYTWPSHSRMLLLLFPT